MTKLAAVSREKHGTQYWKKFTSMSFAEQTSLVPLAARELPRAAVSMPVAFAPEQGGYTLVALLSPVAGQNLFVTAGGKWLGAYVPAVFRAYPFRLVRAPNNSGSMVLCVDEDSGISAEAGEPFFDDDGELAKPVKDILEFLKQMEQNRAGTDRAVEALVETGILAEWDLKVNENPVRGIYRIDEGALNSLDDEAFLRLRKAQALPVAYAQLLSMGNIRLLQRLAEYHEKAETPQVDIESMFGDDDIFKFQ